MTLAMTLGQLTEIANRSTFHRRRAEAMGWTFRDIQVIENPHDFGYLLRGLFTCVCGRTESFVRAIDYIVVHHSNDLRIVDDAFDTVKGIEQFGSFSRKHLEEDGFEPDFIDRVLKIRAEYRE